MTIVFVDPRTEPDPHAPRPSARFTSEVAELEELSLLCHDGRLYDVERWIQDGRPLQLPAGTYVDGRRRFRSALEVALDRQDYSLILLLVANGYDLAAEQECPVTEALRLRRRDLVDLFLAWGADPHRVDLDTLCDTYSSELYEQFRSLGVDLTSGHALAYGLGYHTSNKPLFGFAKRHRLENPRIQRDLDIALAHHAKEANEKGVLLCLWAGADQHASVPWLEFLYLEDLEDQEDEGEGESAIWQACAKGHATILEHLEPDPAVDDFDELYRKAPNGNVVELLARSALPRDHSDVVMSQLAGLAYYVFDWERPLETVRALFEAGVRWKTGSTQGIANVRRGLLKTEEWTFIRLMKLLATDGYCSQEVLTELARTPAIRTRMKKTGLLPARDRERSEFDRSSPTRGRKVLARFGITSSKPTRVAIPLSPIVRIGRFDRDRQELRLSRTDLFERVWSVPVEKLAKEWGLSGRGLTKACHRLQIPTPPRGYWAKVAAGRQVRRPKLPSLPPGQAEEIVVWQEVVTGNG